MEYNMDSGWDLHPIGGDTGQAYMGVKDHERVFKEKCFTVFSGAIG